MSALGTLVHALVRRHKYDPRRGGHAPRKLRRAFWRCVYGRKPVKIDGELRAFDWLVGQLWNCTDRVPSDNINYAQLMRISRTWR